MNIFLLLWIIVFLMMTLFWVYQCRTKDASIVDVGWALGLLMASILFLLKGEGLTLRNYFACAVLGIWSARLSFYLFKNRVWKVHQEDGRYQRMRQAMGNWAHLGFYLFFFAQSLLVLLFALPAFGATQNPSELSVFDILGLGIGLLAITGETYSDYQLAKFRSDPQNKGTTCKIGFWRYSRHPNYFFEWLHWFAYLFFSLTGPYWYLGLMGPILMYVFLMKVTGIPYTEARALSHRSDYLQYQQETSMFFPWFIKKGSSK